MMLRKLSQAPASMLWSAALLLAVLAVVQFSHEVPPSYGADRNVGKPIAPQAAAPQPPPPSARELIGLTALEQQSGLSTPTGAGVVAGHIEGMPGDYLPRIQADAFRGVAFIQHSGVSKPNGHANSTARIIYGPRGLAPGIRTVHCMTIADFVGAGYLRTGFPQPPVANDIRLFSHSWVMRNLPDPGEALRRADYVIDTADVVMVVGVDNGHEKDVPDVLASAYNVIAVGSWTGNSSGGYTLVEGAGRCKPEIVAPGALTSYATPVVAAIVARLQETARGLAESGAASHVEVLKAVLLAGANKPPKWKQAEGKPLDEHFGAGRASLVKSHALLTAGTPEGDRIRRRYGWTFDSLAAGKTRRFTFQTAEPMGGTSLALVWHRRIQPIQAVNMQDRQMYWAGEPKLADLDLRLVRIDEAGAEHVVAESASAIDNVEHIFLPRLQAGRYYLEVTRKDTLPEAWDYALAWRVEKPRIEKAIAEAGR